MARFYLGKDTSGKDLFGDGKYPYVDLRGKIPGDPQPHQGTVYKDEGAIWHWNGPQVVHPALTQLRIDAEYHMRPDAFGPGASTNGIQYEWAIGGDGTKYRLRNPGAFLWHCNNAYYNEHAFACTFLIGEGQRITQAAKNSARELTDALLRIQGLDESACRGHKDVSASTCPGTAYTDFVLPYRAGKLTPTTPPHPGATRAIGEIRGGAIHPLEKVLAWAKGRGAAKPTLEMIPAIYKHAPQRNVGADVLSVQMCHETGFGRYGGASKPYNPAGIKTADATGDAPRDFEVPKTAAEGARMLVNHWCAVLGLDPVGKPHGRYAVARDVYAKRPPITRIEQLGDGNWATDPKYADKLVAYLTEIGRGTRPAPGSGIDLSRYRPTHEYGLTAHSDRVRQHIMEIEHLPLMDPDWHGYRAELHLSPANRTEHHTGRAVDFFSNDLAQLERIVAYLIENSSRDGKGILRVGGIIFEGRQTGYDQWLGDWIPQRWRPPAGWQRDGDFGIADPFHRRYAHVLFNA